MQKFVIHLGFLYYKLSMQVLKLILKLLILLKTKYLLSLLLELTLIFHLTS